ncbi:MAG: hypothetical protein WDN66_03500 [Candidatus Saccharibacteria bacterium]
MSAENGILPSFGFMSSETAERLLNGPSLNGPETPPTHDDDEFGLLGVREEQLSEALIEHLYDTCEAIEEHLYGPINRADGDCELPTVSFDQFCTFRLTRQETQVSTNYLFSRVDDDTKGFMVVRYDDSHSLTRYPSGAEAADQEQQDIWIRQAHNFVTEYATRLGIKDVGEKERAEVSKVVDIVPVDSDVRDTDEGTLPEPLPIEVTPLISKPVDTVLAKGNKVQQSSHSPVRRALRVVLPLVAIAGTFEGGIALDNLYNHYQSGVVAGDKAQLRGDHNLLNKYLQNVGQSCINAANSAQANLGVSSTNSQVLVVASESKACQQPGGELKPDISKYFAEQQTIQQDTNSLDDDRSALGSNEDVYGSTMVNGGLAVIALGIGFFVRVGIKPNKKAA